MKTRLSFVSNSSSSSFLVAYDKDLFGDLNAFFDDNVIGFETSLKKTPDQIDEMIHRVCGTPQEMDDIGKRMAMLAESGKSILCVELDQEHTSLMRILEQIDSANGGGHLDFLICDET